MKRTPKFQNTYLENLFNLSEEHSMKVEAHNALKAHLYDETTTDAERDAWWAKSEELKNSYPVQGGAAKALRAWYWGDTDELELDDHLWDSEVHGFVETLRKAGIETFVYTNQSTALMENLHQLAAEGCTMLGLCTLTKKHRRWGEEEEEQVLGIRFKVN